MIRRILIPPVNEHRFVAYDDIIEGTRYNQHQFDRAWLTEQVRDWQDKRDYTQKKQFKDRCSAQISALPGSTVTLKLYKCDHTLFGDYTMNPVLQANGTALPVYHDDNLYTAYWYFNAKFWEQVGLEKGRYYFIINIENGSNTDQIISEPISLAEKHKGTVLHEWTNSFNKDLCIFEPTKQKFSLRVEGDVLNLQPKVERVSFIDHEYNTTELSATSFRGWTAVVGNNPTGIPDYMFDILNYGWGLSSKRIEGKGYVAADGAEWTKEDGQGSILTSGSLELREQDIDSAYTITKGSIDVMLIPAYPFVSMSVAVGKFGVDDFYYSTATFVNNLTALNNWISALNAAVTNQGLDGTWVNTSGVLQYVLGANETYDQSKAPVLTKFVSINSVTTGSAQNLNLLIGLGAALSGQSAYALVNPSNNVQDAGYISGNSVFTVVSAYIAGAAGNYNTLLFHDNTMNRVQISGDYINNFTGGSFPEQMTFFSLTNSPRITQFSIFTNLLHASNSLTTLVITGNPILTNVNKYSDYTVGTLYGNHMKKLSFLLLTGNNLSSTNLNALYNSMKDPMLQTPNQFTVFNGYINTQLQTGLGQPTNFPNAGNSTTARAMLINTYNWTVLI